MNESRPEPLRASTPQLGVFASQMSIELAPEQARRFEPQADCFPPGSRVFLTHLTGKPEAMQVEAAMRIRQLGYEPVPHLAARNFRSEADYVDLVRAHSRNGVREALFLGGNPLLFAGPLAESAQLLAHSVLRDSTIRTAFVAAYPEGHPQIPETHMLEALQRKRAICLNQALDLRVVSQFAFDGKVIGTWARKLQERNPGLPLHIGLAGVTSVTKLIRFAALCGVGSSLAALRRSAGGLLNVIADRNPGDLLEAIAASYCAPVAPLHLHFFPFGGWDKTLAWFRDYREAGHLEQRLS